MGYQPPKFSFYTAFEFFEMYQTMFEKRFIPIMKILGIKQEDFPDDLATMSEDELMGQVNRLMKSLYREFLKAYEEGECNVYCKLFKHKKTFDIYESAFLAFVYDVFATAIAWLWKDMGDGKIVIKTASHEEIGKYLDRAYEYQINNAYASLKEGKLDLWTYMADAPAALYKFLESIGLLDDELLDLLKNKTKESSK